MHTKQCSITVYTAVACDSCPSDDITKPLCLKEFPHIFMAPTFLVVSINNEHNMYVVYII